MQPPSWARRLRGSSSQWLRGPCGVRCGRRGECVSNKKAAAPQFSAAAEIDRRRHQAALDAFLFTLLRSATVLSFVFAAFSSLRFVVRKRTMSS